MNPKIKEILDELRAEKLRPVPPKPSSGYDVEANQRALEEWADQVDDEEDTSDE